MGQKRPYMPAKYKIWQRNLRALMAEWWTSPPLTSAVVHMTFNGPARSDLENLAGAVLDAGNKLIWEDDRVGVIREQNFKFNKSPINNQSIHLTIFWP
jgi:Holliday junction resolvase RusA-like endonuclease